MEDINRVYRIRTKVGEDAPNVIHVPLNQSYDMFEILSLKLRQTNTYKTYESDYGIIVGRVTANGGFGIPNAKVSVFISVEDDETLKNRLLYNFTNTSSTDYDGVRYNLLPDYVDDMCHQNVGTFPNKRLVLDNNDVIEMFDKYWKYTTSTNHSGDYMLFGIPTGSQQLHVDVDLSDCGILSQRPRDMIGKGYNANMFESPNKFKYSTNLNSLAQIVSQDKGVYVYPYWGDVSDGDDKFSITRCDINVEYKFESYAVFMGCIVTDKGSNAIGKNCTGTEKNGKMSDLIAGEGRIEMIRKTLDGKVEEFPIMGNRLIDGDGVWCYQIPMNLDYVTTDEFGNLVPTDNPEKGIATRTRVRFRISLDETPNDATARKRARYLVPNNPRIGDNEFVETKMTIDYEFGSSTREESYCDMFWNKVYTVKNYIPKLQKNTKVTNRKHTGIKLINHYEDNNPMPYNALTIKLTFTYRLICVIVKVFIRLVEFINIIISILGALPCWLATRCFFGICPFKWALKFVPGCIELSSDFCDDGINPNVYYPGCGTKAPFKCIWEKKVKSECQKEQAGKDREDQKLCKNSPGELETCVENELAQQNDATSFNFYNDWINGTLYAPLWYRKIRRKRKFFFGLFTRKAKDEWCTSNKNFSSMNILHACSVIRDKQQNYTNFDNKQITAYYHDNAHTDKCKKSECNQSVTSVRGMYGVINPKETMLGETVYYYVPVEYDESLPQNKHLYMDNKPEGEIKLLFATDIVLLGSLNDCDMNGVPQFFKNLESTTYNLPSDILFTDHDIKNILDVNGNFVEAEYKEISEMAGCDWGNKNQYGKEDGGLFYDIGCSKIKMVEKSCFNLTRICEFGVSLDETKLVPKLDTLETKGDEAFEELITDGFVSWDELYNLDERSMFATMNGNRLATKRNEKNGLLEYDFRYLYPENFDGSLKTIMKETTKKYNSEVTYRNNYKLEDFSRDYYIFRMGNEPYYYDDKNNGRTFARYENSYYFYFGLKAGKTAIEKFNSKYFAECMNPDIVSNQIGIRYQPNSWCSMPSIFDPTVSYPINSRVLYRQNTESEYKTYIFTDVHSGVWDSGHVIEEPYNGMSTLNDGYVAFDFSKLPSPYNLLINGATNRGFSIEIDNITDEKVVIGELTNYVTMKGNTVNGNDYMWNYDSESEKQIPMLDNGSYIANLSDADGNITEFYFTIETKYISFKTDVQDFRQPNNVLGDDYEAIANNKQGLNYDEETKQTTREIGGVISIYDIYVGNEKVENYRIEVKPKKSIGNYAGTAFNNNENNPQILGLIKYDKDKDIYGVGVPKGGVIYEVTIYETCNGIDSDNIVSIDVFVDEPMPYKMYINDVDYDLIKNFNKFQTGPNAGKYTDGWLPYDGDSKKIKDRRVSLQTKSINGRDEQIGEVIFEGNPWFNLDNIWNNQVFKNISSFETIEEVTTEEVPEFISSIKRKNYGVRYLEMEEKVITNVSDTWVDKDGIEHVATQQDDGIEVIDYSYVPKELTIERVGQEWINYDGERRVSVLSDIGKVVEDYSDYWTYISHVGQTWIDWDGQEQTATQTDVGQWKKTIKRMTVNSGDSWRDENGNLIYATQSDMGRTVYNYSYTTIPLSNLISEFTKENVNTQGSNNYVYYTWSGDYIAKDFDKSFDFEDGEYNTDNIYDLVNIVNEFIEKVNEVIELRKELPSLMREAFYINCTDEQKAINITVHTSNMPAVVTLSYQEETTQENSNENILTDRKNITSYESNISDVNIPTITYACSERFGYAEEEDKYEGNVFKSKYRPVISRVGKYDKHAYYVGAMNDMKDSIPSGLAPKKVNGIWQIDENERLANLFDFPIIDKSVSIKYVAWSYFNNIPYYKKTDANDNYVIDVVNMSGSLASTIFNGSVTNNEFDEQTLFNIKLKLSDNLINSSYTYVERRVLLGYDYSIVDAELSDEEKEVQNFLRSEGFVKYLVEESISVTNPKQYAQVLPMQTEFRLTDANGCGINKTIYGNMVVELTDESVNNCINGEKILEVESYAGEEVVFYSVISLRGQEDKYPLNYAEKRTATIFGADFTIYQISADNEIKDKMSTNTPYNIFSFAMTSNDFKNEICDKSFNSKLVVKNDDGTERSYNSKGVGTTGHFEREGNNSDDYYPIYVVAFTDSGNRAISPVYDYSRVEAVVKAGILTRKDRVEQTTETIDSETGETITVTELVDVFTSDYKLGIALNEGREGYVVPYYFQYYPYRLKGTCKLNDTDTIEIQEETLNGVGNFIFANMTEIQYNIFSLKARTLVFLNDMLKVTPITATDYTGLKHICGFNPVTPVELTNWVTYIWRANLPNGVEPSRENGGIKFVRQGESGTIEYYTSVYEEVYEVGKEVKSPTMAEGSITFLGWSENEPNSSAARLNIVETATESKVFYGNWNVVVPVTRYTVRFCVSENNDAQILETRSVEEGTTTTPFSHNGCNWYRKGDTNRQKINFNTYTINRNVDFAPLYTIRFYENETDTQPLQTSEVAATFNVNGYGNFSWYEKGDVDKRMVSFPYQVVSNKDFVKVPLFNVHYYNNETDTQPQYSEENVPYGTSVNDYGLNWYDRTDANKQSVIFPYSVTKDVDFIRIYDTYNVYFLDSDNTELDRQVVIQGQTVSPLAEYQNDYWYLSTDTSKTRQTFPYTVNDNTYFIMKKFTVNWTD